MLTNILNTLTIALSLGTSVMQNEQKPMPKPNRANTVQNDYNIQIEYDEEDYATETVQLYAPENNVMGVNTEILVQPFYVLNSYVIAVGITITQYSIVNIPKNAYPEIITPSQQTYVDTYPYARVKENNYAFIPKTDTGTRVNIPTVQRITYMELTPNNNNVNTHIDTYVHWNMTQPGLPLWPQEINGRQYNYEYTITNKNLEEYTEVGTNYFNRYTKNNNLYEKYTELKYGLNGYNTQIKETVKDITNEDLQNDGLELTQNIQIQPNKKTYLVIYEQPMFTQDTVPTRNNCFIATNPIESTLVQYYNMNYFELVGTNVIVPGTTEVVDIPGVMFTVLGMPFTFISTAFNLTLFPGTPYELNISTLFLSIFAVLIFVFIVRTIIKSKTGG